MQELIKSLVSELGVTEAQARGGAGAIFKAAQERLGDSEFEQLLGGVPGIKDLLQQAPTDSSGGGLLGGLASVVGKMGTSDMARAAQLLATFSSLGLNKDTGMKFLPIMMRFLESHGGKDLVANLRAALKL